MESRTHDHWATPKELFDELDREFCFDFDPCPLHATFDGLIIPRGKCNYVNPPYNRKDKPKFIKKAYYEMLKGNTSVLLIPVKTSTADFHDYILPYAEIRFLRGRPKFLEHGKEGNSAGRNDIMVCIFRGKNKKLDE